MKSSGADWISEELTVAGDLLFNAYGGPDGGRLVSVPAGTIDHWAYRSDAIMPKGAQPEDHGDVDARQAAHLSAGRHQL